MKLPTLYGNSTNGKKKLWEIEVKGNVIYVTHGQVGGKLQTKETTVFGKNIGKANETTNEEQAHKEAEAKWLKQIDKNYSENIESSGQLMNPMLAYDYRKHGNRIKYPCYGQAKLDGVRALVYLVDGSVVYMSRGGKQYPNIPHITETLIPLFNENPSLILDGELYLHGESLQNIVSLVKKPKAGSELLEFWVFDVVTTHDYNYRRTLVKTLSSLYSKEGAVTFVKDFIINNEHEMLKVHNELVSLNYEGIMLRNKAGLYTLNHRSADLQKYKVFLDKEFEIIGSKPDEDGCVVWRVQVAEGIECDVTPAGTKESRKELLKVAEQYYGKYLKVKFQAYTDSGNLQFPTGIELDRTDN